MRPIAITALLALCAPMASAGDFDFKFDFRDLREALREGRRNRDRGHRHERHERHDHGHRHDECETYCTRHWVPARWVTVERRVWVPGYYETVYRPAEYEWRYDRCGYRTRVLVRPACYEQVHVPGRWEVRCERQLVPGHYHYHCNTRGHRHDDCDRCGH
mgnify:CR=1 FL=1